MGIMSQKSYPSEIDIKQLTAPSGQLVTTAEQKMYSRIDGNLEDSLIDQMIKASTKQCEQFVRGGFLTRTWKQSEDYGENQNLFEAGWPLGFIKLIGGEFAIEIKNTHVTSIQTVTFYDISNNATVISNILYRLDRPDSDQPSRLVFNLGTQIGFNSRQFTQYEIAYTAGYANTGAVPEDIKLAVMATVQAWYEVRETMGQIPDWAKQVLRNYRVIEL